MSAESPPVVPRSNRTRVAPEACRIRHVCEQPRQAPGTRHRQQWQHQQQEESNGCDQAELSAARITGDRRGCVVVIDGPVHGLDRISFPRKDHPGERGAEFLALLGSPDSHVGRIRTVFEAVDHGRRQQQGEGRPDRDDHRAGRRERLEPALADRADGPCDQDQDDRDRREVLVGDGEEDAEGKGQQRRRRGPAKPAGAVSSSGKQRPPGEDRDGEIGAGGDHEVGRLAEMGLAPGEVVGKDGEEDCTDGGRERRDVEASEEEERRDSRQREGEEEVDVDRDHRVRGEKAEGFDQSEVETPDLIRGVVPHVLAEGRRQVVVDQEPAVLEDALGRHQNRADVPPAHVERVPEIGPPHGQRDRRQ